MKKIILFFVLLATFFPSSAGAGAAEITETRVAGIDQTTSFNSCKAAARAFYQDGISGGKGLPDNIAKIKIKKIFDGAYECSITIEKKWPLTLKDLKK